MDFKSEDKIKVYCNNMFEKLPISLSKNSEFCDILFFIVLSYRCYC
ncbi:hypothetical protein Q0M62_00905 [Staphylococcus aureus]|nr:hypothetical protein [Staphylococcus aureus]MDN8761424.1 hypothetical protein [Staphylococcus aureus]MDN8763809.1 hypothetical protein [Staphylococcus aureus]MDN8774376.1 hypothetical protein [Staphylococcus aureus]NHF01260.1 hypothetical protein [Staphylococcus aureus]NHF38317.1 hypothetical protein [Staphylococcus aureus]